MKIAIVGCGYVADYYVKTLSLHPELELVGVMDRDPERVARFSAYYSLPTYSSFDELLADARVDLVLNLTNPQSHFEVSKALLEAGKHVYSEKPIAMKFSQAEELVDLAEARGLHLSSAPCTFLNEAAQTVAKALREDCVGKIRLVYAEMDDGNISRAPYKKWLSESGTPWPYRNEFEVGCTIEHAGYAVTCLSGLFGPAQSVTAFSTCLMPDKGIDPPLDVTTADFSVAAIKFRSGVVARLTCSIFAPRKHALEIFGDDGVLTLADLWHDRSPVYIKKLITIRRKTLLTPWKRRVPLVGKSNPQVKYRGAQQRNFCRGIAEMAEAIKQGRSPRLATRYCLHNTEIVLAIQESLETGSSYTLSSTFDAIEPMPYAGN